jgi:hypothetical protein
MTWTTFSARTGGVRRRRGHHSGFWSWRRSSGAGTKIPIKPVSWHSAPLADHHRPWSSPSSTSAYAGYLALSCWRVGQRPARTSRSWCFATRCACSSASSTRVRYRPADRAIRAALSRLLPRGRWRCFLVTPEILLRWHRDAAKKRGRRWRAQSGPGRPPLSDELDELIVRLGTGCLAVARVGATRRWSGARQHRWRPPCSRSRSRRGPRRAWARP